MLLATSSAGIGLASGVLHQVNNVEAISKLALNGDSRRLTLLPVELLTITLSLFPVP